MRRPWSHVPFTSTLLAAVVIAAVTAGLGTLQHHWVSQVGEVELAQLRTAVRKRADEVTRQIDEEVARAFLTFLVADDGDVAAALHTRLKKWRREAPHADLVKDVYFATRAGQQLGPLSRLDSQGASVAAQWPPLLDRMRGWLDRTVQRLGPVVRSTDLLSGRALAIAVPIYPAAGAGTPPQPPRGFAFVQFDQTQLMQVYTPRLIERAFAGQTDDYDVTLLSPEERAGDRPAGKREPDLVVSFFNLRLDRVTPAAGVQPPSQILFDPRGLEGRKPGWGLAITRRDGSIEQAVHRLRLRNLTVGLAALVLLSGSAATLLLTARRARRLAEQQRMLVAGFSHELRTPLAVLRSAGENLRDGIVRERAQIERYGRSIEQQARRLSDLVERVLETATDDPLGAAAAMPIDPVDVVEAALATHAAELERRGFVVERHLMPAPHPLCGDRDALRRAIENLIDNALKHAASGKWIAVHTRRASDDTFEIVVEDRGPGLPDEERRHVFTAFFRGRAARGGQLRGVGLGLHLVRRTARAHGGDVSVEPVPQGGARFCLTLPIGETPASNSPIASGRPA